MTEDEYYEAMEREHLALQAVPKVKGHEAVSFDGECDRCGKTKHILYGHTACTLGYPGHPGAEFTQFQVCEECVES
jgi:hypothetical protein